MNEIERDIEPWRLAIFKLRDQLKRHCLRQAPERRRLQNGRLVRNFLDAYHSLSAPGKSLLMSYWLFCGSPFARRLPYKEARREHYAELKEHGFPKEFDPPDSQLKANKRRVITEFMVRLNSLASWIEAQESWIFWRTLCNRLGAWNQHDPRARQLAIDSDLIRLMPILANEVPDWMITDFVKSFRRWLSSDWAKILKAAVRDSGKMQDQELKLETWVWWRYPIFSRYRWSTAEVCRAAREKFGKIHHVDHEGAFQLFWVRRGIRFTGKRTRRKLPPLWEFVISRDVPTNIALKYPTLM